MVQKTERYSNDPCCLRLKKSSCGKYLKFFVLLVLGILNLAINWFFYARVCLEEPGLVYGPPHQYFKTITFSFCIAATVVFCLETIHNVDDLNEKIKIRFLTQSVTNFIQIYFENLPILLLNLVLKGCHDGAPTVTAVIKSSISIALFTTRFIIIFVYRCAKTTKRSLFRQIIDTFSIVGLVLVLLVSVKIQLLRIFPTHSNGGFVTRLDPMEFNEMDFATYKYLDNVGIYTRWPIEDNDKNSEEYFYIADITEVINNTFLPVIIQTDYEINKFNYSLCISKLNNYECFTMNTNIDFFSKVNPDLLNLNKFDKYELTLTKEPAQTYKHLLGYLDYNMNRIQVTENGNSSCSSATAASILYGKFLPFSSLERTFLRNDGKGFSFYNHDIDLQTVDKLWKTGIFKCQMTGDVGPKLSRKIRLC